MRLLKCFRPNFHFKMRASNTINLSGNSHTSSRQTHEIIKIAINSLSHSLQNSLKFISGDQNERHKIMKIPNHNPSLKGILFVATFWVIVSKFISWTRLVEFKYGWLIKFLWLRGILYIDIESPTDHPFKPIHRIFIVVQQKEFFIKNVKTICAISKIKILSKFQIN
jgi:hypothetical protein